MFYELSREIPLTFVTIPTETVLHNCFFPGWGDIFGDINNILNIQDLDIFGIFGVC